VPQSRADESADETIALLRAVVMLLLDSRDGDAPKPRTSIELLTLAGFNYKQIADLTGRTPDGVRMAVNRAKAAPAKKPARNVKTPNTGSETGNG